MKHIRSLGYILFGVFVLAAVVVIQGYVHDLSVQHTNTAIAVQLNKEGIKNFGAPDSANGVVPVFVSPGCKINFYLVYEKHGLLSLTQKNWDASQQFMGPVDSISDAASEAAVQTNLVTILKANVGKQHVCTTTMLSASK